MGVTDPTEREAKAAYQHLRGRRGGGADGVAEGARGEGGRGETHVGAGREGGKRVGGGKLAAALPAPPPGYPSFGNTAPPPPPGGKIHWQRLNTVNSAFIAPS